MELTIQQRNEQLFATKFSVGSHEHCGCEDCAFYANNIIKNTELVTFLHAMGVDARKADEAWCYNTEDGYKYYLVDFFRLHADREGTFVFGNITMTLFFIPYTEKNELCYGMALDGALKIE